MKQKILYFISLLSLMIVICGCSVSTDSNTGLFQYNDSYVGDNSAVGNIVNQLAHNEELKQISLHTKEQPYGITMTYGELDAADKERKEMIISNATFLFALIKNVDWMTFEFPDQQFTVTKKKLENWYNNKLVGFSNEQEIAKLVEEQLKSEGAVQQFFIE